MGTILCGTDFSPGGDMAALAAARLAKRSASRLCLAHVAADVPGRAHDLPSVERQLRLLAEKLADQLGIEVDLRVAGGAPAEGLAKLAGELHAELVIVSAVSHAEAHRFVGSTAERVAQLSPAPVLVLRDAGWAERWVAGDVPLRLMVALEPGSPTGHAALRWAVALGRFGRTELTVVQVAWPFGEHVRLGIAPPIPLDHLRPEVAHVLQRDLEACGRQLGAPAGTHYFVSHGLGRTEYVLADLALRHGSDLLVVGTHQRAGFARFWQGSVSRGAIHTATCSVVTVPASAADRAVLAPATYRRVVVATDFSPLAARAIPFAQAMVGHGTVHLVTVAHGLDHAARETLRGKLLALVAGVPWREAGNTVEVVDSADVPAGICAAAERSGADAICLATHGRTGIVRLALGSQAQGVLERSRLPVLLVPPPRDT